MEQQPLTPAQIAQATIARETAKNVIVQLQRAISTLRVTPLHEAAPQVSEDLLRTLNHQLEQAWQALADAQYDMVRGAQRHMQEVVAAAKEWTAHQASQVRCPGCGINFEEAGNPFCSHPEGCGSIASLADQA